MIVLMSGERQWMKLERRKRGRRRVIILATMGLYAGLGRWHICCSFHVFSVASFIFILWRGLGVGGSPVLYNAIGLAQVCKILKCLKLLLK